MHKYQIVLTIEKSQHAGSKAKEDVIRFAEESGYEPLYVRCYLTKSTNVIQRTLRYFIPFWGWLKVYLKVKKGSVVLLQKPFHHKQFFRKKCLSLLKTKKGCKIISLLHDVDLLRGSNWLNGYIENEFKFTMSNSDYEIVHNQFMKDALKKMGYSEEQMVSLEIFDYYIPKKPSPKTITELTADVAIAGNFDPKKSSYIYLLKNLKNTFKINLYGPDYRETEKTDFIKYNGSFPADEVPNVLDAKFGLVWDGDGIDCCSNQSGNYLRYNNPHKTSLYLVSRLPVIVWKQAAMARFVEQENVGITVESLEEIRDKINSISAEDYNVMCSNVEKIAGRLEKGYYLKAALDTCEKLALK